MGVIESIIHEKNHEFSINDNDLKLQKLISDYYFPDFMYYFKKWSKFEQAMLETKIESNIVKNLSEKVFLDYRHYIHGNIVFMVEFLSYPNEVLTYYDVYVYDKTYKSSKFSYIKDFKRIMHKYYSLDEMNEYNKVLNQAYCLISESEKYIYKKNEE